MEQEKSFCLFDGDAGPLAVSVESVAAVLETEFLVPLVWSPPQVIGLCPYHREVVPVISLRPSERGPGADREPDDDIPPAVGAASVAAKDRFEEKTRCVVLILRTEHDAWGLRIDRVDTFISRADPEFHPPRRAEHGSTLIGVLTSEGSRYSILDAEATWCGLRTAITSWYGLINEPGFYSTLTAGEQTREAATGTTG
jgi:chemotaxis signal transduction protein